MSHTTTIKNTVIRDIDALRAAVADLQAKGVDCDLLEGAVPRMYYGNQHGQCDYVLKLHQSKYDVGFDKQADGSYVPVLDTFGGHVQRAIGVSHPTCALPSNRDEAEALKAIGQFQQAYAVHATINAAVQQGYMVEGHSVDEHGNVHLTLGGM